MAAELGCSRAGVPVHWRLCQQMLQNIFVDHACKFQLKVFALELLEATTSVSLTFKVFKTDHCWGNFLVHICFSVLDIVFLPHL